MDAPEHAAVTERTVERDVPIIRISPSRGWSALNLRELWDGREVVYFLALRDLKARYKQTVFGASWAVLQPVISMLLFSVIFGGLAKMPSDGIPYPIFAFAALVPWTYFSNSVSRASNSLVGGGSMVSRIYFPRLALPLAPVLACTLDFLLAFSVLLLMMVYFEITPTMNVVWLPLLLLLAFTTALGVSLVLAAMNVQFRDVRHAVPFLVQLWMYATPVVYPASLIESEVWRTVYSLNPMVGVVEGFRWALLGTDTAPGASVLVSSCVALTLVVLGLFYFKRMERTFADVV